MALGATMLSTSIGAQETLQNDKGVDILPVAGEFALGFNAVPIFNFVGNAFNGNTNNQFIGQNKYLQNAFGNNVIMGKYMLEDKVAIRANLNITTSALTNRNYVTNDVADSPDSLVTDIANVNNQMFVIGGGYEMRKGEGRIQAIYGADLAIMFGGGNASYEYGNAYGEVNQAPTSSDWGYTPDGVPTGDPGTAGPMGDRTVSSKGGSMFGVGARPFVGIEFFFAPKISLGAEFGWNIMYMTQGDGQMTTEHYNPSVDEVRRRTVPTAGQNTFATGIDNFNGAIFLMFYF